jgi:hypothetical protein
MKIGILYADLISEWLAVQKKTTDKLHKNTIIVIEPLSEAFVNGLCTLLNSDEVYKGKSLQNMTLGKISQLEPILVKVKVSL